MALLVCRHTKLLFPALIFLLSKSLSGLAQIVTSPVPLTSVPLGPFGIDTPPASVIPISSTALTTVATAVQSTVATSPPAASVANPSANSLPGQAADFIHTLNHEQLVSFLQIMLTQNGGQAPHPLPAVVLTGLQPVQTSMSLNSDDKNVVVNVNLHGTNSAGTSPLLSGSSPLLQLTIFRKAGVNGLLRSVDNFGKSELGRYVTDLHRYWALSSVEKRTRNRSMVQKHVASLSVSPGMYRTVPKDLFHHGRCDLKQAIREVLPGL